MGMTIDRATSGLLSITAYEGDYIPIYDTDVEVIAFAIEIMHKYQIIEKIINAPDGCSSARYNAIFNIVKHYGEVVEDGNS